MKRYICVDKPSMVNKTAPIRIDYDKGEGEREFHEGLIIYGQDGKEACRLIWRTKHPWKCGAQVWIVTECEVEPTPKDESDGG